MLCSQLPVYDLLTEWLTIIELVFKQHAATIRRGRWLVKNSILIQKLTDGTIHLRSKFASLSIKSLSLQIIPSEHSVFTILFTITNDFHLTLAVAITILALIMNLRPFSSSDSLSVYHLASVLSWMCGLKGYCLVFQSWYCGIAVSEGYCFESSLALKM